MLSERDIELAHPDAFDFVWGNLPAAKRVGFGHHLGGCRHCQAIVDEYGEIGRIIKNLPPHVEPPADLEKRTVTTMVAALAEQRAKTDRRAEDKPPPASTRFPSANLWPKTRSRLYPSPANQPPPAEPPPAEPPPAEPPPAERHRPSRHRPSRHRPSRKPERWSLGACVATLSRPPRCCRCCRCCRCRRHCCRRYGPTQPRQSPSRGSHLQARSTPGIGRGGFGHGGGPTRCFWELGYHLDRAPPQEL